MRPAIISQIQMMMVAVVDPVAASIYNKIATAGGGNGAYWDLSESSGTRADKANAYANMTVSGTISTGNGPRGVGDTAAAFPGGANYLDFTTSGNDGTDIPSGGGNHCFFGWIYCNNLSSFYDSGRWNSSSSPNLQYILRVDTSGNVSMYNGGAGYVAATTSGSITASSWNFLVGWRDNSDGKVRVCFNDGTVAVSSSTSSPTSGTAVHLGLGGTQGQYLDGRMSRWGYVKGAILTPTEITWLYNAGAGRDWAEIKALAGH